MGEWNEYKRVLLRKYLDVKICREYTSEGDELKAVLLRVYTGDGCEYTVHLRVITGKCGEYKIVLLKEYPQKEGLRTRERAGTEKQRKRKVRVKERKRVRGRVGDEHVKTERKSKSERERLIQRKSDKERDKECLGRSDRPTSKRRERVEGREKKERGQIRRKQREGLVKDREANTEREGERERESQDSVEERGVNKGKTLTDRGKQVKTENRIWGGVRGEQVDIEREGVREIMGNKEGVMREKERVSKGINKQRKRGVNKGKRERESRLILRRRLWGRVRDAYGDIQRESKVKKKGMGRSESQTSTERERRRGRK
uniref:Uncharacterized protein n=1 Tax=Octopus bimaculoides TaxID=37653 RepID=A0A0L8G554_OCTBM